MKKSKALHLFLNICLCFSILISGNLYPYLESHNLIEIEAIADHQDVISAHSFAENHSNTLIFEDDEVIESEVNSTKKLPRLFLTLLGQSTINNQSPNFLLPKDFKAIQFAQYAVQHIPLHIAFSVFII